jgi:glycosyltransferase involved in cell wall biosynthesis
MIVNEKNNIDWYLMGGIGYLDLYNLKQNNLIKTGWYKRNEIFDLLHRNEIDVVCILSTVEETFCYTLSESIGAKIPVIATDVGALGQRIKKLKCGWLVDRNADSQEILNLLNHISSNYDEYSSIKENLNNIKVKNLDEMGVEYDKIYEKVFRIGDMRISKIALIKQFQSTANTVVIKSKLDRLARVVCRIKRKFYERWK